jgi:hypothetical protein
MSISIDSRADGRPNHTFVGDAPGTTGRRKVEGAGMSELEGSATGLPGPVAKAHLQTQFLVELLLKNDHNEVRRVLQQVPDDELMPLLGAALIYGAEAMRDHFGTKRALKTIATARQKVGHLT